MRLNDDERDLGVEPRGWGVYTPEAKGYTPPSLKGIYPRAPGVYTPKAKGYIPPKPRGIHPRSQRVYTPWPADSTTFGAALRRMRKMRFYKCKKCIPV